MRYLTIDGMLSGTGIRDAVEGGYVQLNTLGLSESLQQRVSRWVDRYEEAHYRQHDDPREVDALDAEGLCITQLVRTELPEWKVDYFSSAKMKKIAD